jgi:methionyl aminopeptidase
MSRIWIKTKEEITALRESGRRLALVVKELAREARPGVTTAVLGERADALIRAQGGIPIFLGYGTAWGAPPFPAAVCLSLNEEVVHGIPRSDRVLREGDLLKIDIGMRYEGMVTDMARMVAIGTLPPAALRVKTVTEQALTAGEAVLRPGATMEEYAQAVEKTAQEAGFSCVKSLVGHGVGRELHEEPQIANYSGSGLPNFRFEAGMTVALEPMLNIGVSEVELAADGWTYVTADGRLSGHCEDTVLITESGYEIVTTV